MDFLTVLRGVSDAFAINDATLAYWERPHLTQDVGASLTAGSRQSPRWVSLCSPRELRSTYPTTLPNP
jgi:hypothetical protein